MRAPPPASSPPRIRRRPPAPISRSASRSIRWPRRPSATRPSFPRSNSAAKTDGWSATAIPVIAAPTATASPGALRPRPIPREINPRAVFERLFGEADLDPATRAKRALYNKSILDFVTDDTRRLQGNLGATDRRKLDEYLLPCARSSSASRRPRRTAPNIRRRRWSVRPAFRSTSPSTRG